jgi:hypothetical protein
MKTMKCQVSHPLKSNDTGQKAGSEGETLFESGFPSSLPMSRRQRKGTK